MDYRALGSTGIGQGVAVPHTRHPTLQRLIGTVALSRRGVDFAALDGEPVDIFFLLVSLEIRREMTLGELASVPRAAIVVRPRSGDVDSTAMRPPLIPMFRMPSSPDAGSMTRPPVTTRS